MAKKSDIEDAVIVTDETTNASMPELAIVPVKSYEVQGNFDEVEKFLKGVRAKYKDLVFTDETIDKAKIIKAELVTLRTSITKIQANVKAERFNNPKKIFDARMEALLAITGEVEQEIDAALAKEDQKRIDELTEAFETYKEHYGTVHCLRPEYAERVEFKKSFYNKTAVEKDSKADIEAQVKALAAEQKARDGNIKLLKRALADTPEINFDEQVAKLDRGDDIASILEWIDGEIERLEAVANEKQEKATVGIPGSPENSDDYLPDDDEEEAEEPVSQCAEGIARKMDFSTDFPGKTKSLVVQITYPIDAGDALTKLFKELKGYGINTRPVKPSELVGGGLS